MEELKSSPPKDDKSGSRESLNGQGVSSSSSSKGGAGRLFRRISERAIDRSHSRQSSRNGERYDHLLETLGRSLSATTHLSMTSLASTRSFGKQDVESHDGRSSPSIMTPWRRGRAASNASSKDIGPPQSSVASFPRHFARSIMISQADDSSIDSPPTSHSSKDQHSFTSISPPPDTEEGIAAAPRSKKLLKKTMRSRHSNSADCDSIQLYMLRLSPPPRGLATDEIEGRKRLVCNYVQAKLEENNKRLSKSAYMRPLTAAPPVLPSRTAEECIETLEDAFQQWMYEDMKHEFDVLRYTELHLADVFIEARRSLGVDSMSSRLHSMFDVNPMQVPNVTTMEAKRASMASDPPPMSTPPPSAWDNNVRKPTSLTPAPRRRRPKTTPTNKSCFVDDIQRRDTSSNGDSPTFSNSSHLSSHRKASGSIDSSLEGIDSGWTKEDQPQQRKDSSVAFPSIHGPTSLPPSPPKSIDSHHFAEVIPYTAPLATRRILSEVLPL